MVKWQKNPAIVRYIGKTNNDFTNGKEYEAFFLEYMQGVRNSLHARNNDGKICDYNPFEDFEIITDEDNILNYDEAIVRCITHKHEGNRGLRYGKEYKAIGCDKDGFFLVMDESDDCYFYPSEFFEIIQDEKDILSQRSIYYNYKEQDIQ